MRRRVGHAVDPLQAYKPKPDPKPSTSPTALTRTLAEVLRALRELAMPSPRRRRRRQKHALVAFAESGGGALREHPHVLGWRVVAWDRSTLVPLLPCPCPAWAGGGCPCPSCTQNSKLRI